MNSLPPDSSPVRRTADTAGLARAAGGHREPRGRPGHRTGARSGPARRSAAGTGACSSGPSPKACCASDVDMGGAQTHAVAARTAPAAHQGHHDGRHLRAARFPSVSREPAVRAHAQGHRAGIREVRAHHRADQPRGEAAAGARAPGGAFRGAPAGQAGAPRHRHAHGARMGAATTAPCRAST